MYNCGYEASAPPGDAREPARARTSLPRLDWNRHTAESDTNLEEVEGVKALRTLSICGQ
ncbi:hypothetical protein CERSUDRAFT_114480 [Gelatoporia subvermispora B]|uniref:Uncharacterized protein n=1 Tax=Ceriporiopsis subvermispora (strain B) TaxID=914234 RepID=M2RH65_CERS8|nr:hypothetical protein CERSUDRAFT_114480 [Gelatoporia subvermispora B]